MRPIFQKECVERKGDDKDEEGEDEIGKSPSLRGDQILDQRDQNKNSNANSHSGKAIDCSPFSLKPLRKNDCKRGDTETGHTHSNDDTEKEIELEERLNLCAEKKSQSS